jgi:hypothetical protein
MAEDDDQFVAGRRAGEVAERLSGHDKHFAAINGSIADLATEMRSLVLAVQRLGDAMTADRATVLTTAAALKEAESARRDRSDQSWSPWSKALALAGGVAALVGAYLALRPR